MIIPFREHQPQRTYTVTHKDYRKYKKPLAKDFQNKCGYTNCHHSWFGGITNFHIDHFKAKSLYPLLVNDYENLVYATSFVNISKSDDDNDLYLDPCKVDFNLHFERDTHGNILPKSDSPHAKYMYEKLKLYLERYGIIAKLEYIYQTWLRNEEAIELITDEESKSKFVSYQKDISYLFMKYYKYLRVELYE
jgi:hypothetical protein